MGKRTRAAEPTIHALLREWRGEMKLDRAAVYLSDELKREISRETIRRYEVKDEAPKTLDPGIVGGLLKVYGHTISELPEDVGSEVANLRDLLVGQSPCNALDPEALVTRQLVA